MAIGCNNHGRNVQKTGKNTKRLPKKERKRKSLTICSRCGKEV